MNVKADIENRIEKIQKMGHQEIIRLARKVLADYVTPHTFTMAMGTFVFSDRYGRNIYRAAYSEEIDEFLCGLDVMICLTGRPVRILKDGSIDSEYSE